MVQEVVEEQEVVEVQEMMYWEACAVHLDLIECMIIITMESPLVDPLNKGHNRNNLSTLLEVPNVHFPIVLTHFQPLKRGQPLYKEQNGWSQRVLYSEVPRNYS